MKVDAYKCDHCKIYVEGEETTHAIITLRGARTARYAPDLCPECSEKLVPSDAEPAPAVTTVLPTAERRPRAGRRTPEEIAECLRVGQAMLLQGKDVEGVAAHFGIRPTTWYTWLGRGSASVSASEPERQLVGRGKTGL